MIDSHIHLDSYDEADARAILAELKEAGVDKVIAVSMNLASCRKVHELYSAHPDKVLPAYGFHPERAIPSEQELDMLLGWIRSHQQEMIAIGEVGLPYYTWHEALKQGQPFALGPYIELLDQFTALAAELNKPIILHAVYEDADIACDLLEKHNVSRAHFHWFKGAPKTVERMMRNGYYVSFTPDIVYEDEIRTLAMQVPPDRMMVETDGPWPFEGPFQGQMTHPRMIHAVALELAAIKGMDIEAMAGLVRRNTDTLYNL